MVRGQGLALTFDAPAASSTHLVDCISNFQITGNKFLKN